MEQQLQKLTQAILARGELLEQLQNQYAALQASVEEMKPIRPEVKTETKPAEPVVSDPLLRAEVPQSVTPPALASSSRSLATGELDALMPTGCSMNGPDDDTDSRTSAFMPDAAPGPPSTAALLDVAITSSEPTDATILVRDGTGELTPTPSGTAVHLVDLGDEHVPNLSNCQLGARKVFDRMCGTDGVSYGFSTNGLVLTTCCPDESSTTRIAVVDRATRRREQAHRVLILARLENSCGAMEFRPPWPPPMQVDVACSGVELGLMSWLSCKDCRGVVKWRPPWSPIVSGRMLILEKGFCPTTNSTEVMCSILPFDHVRMFSEEYQMCGGCRDTVGALTGRSYSLLQRLGAILRNGAKLFAVGTSASLIGTGVTNALTKARKAVDKELDDEIEDIPMVSSSVAYGIYMAVSNNLSYQVLAGVIEQRMLEPLLHNHKLLLEQWLHFRILMQQKHGGDGVRASGIELDVVSYGVIVNCLCRFGKLDEAVACFRNCVEKGVAVNAIFYASLIYGCDQTVYTYTVLIDNSEVLQKCYGPEADVWSAGVILYIVLCGVSPFWEETEAGIFRQNLRGKLDFEYEPWPIISDSTKDLVRNMLNRDPERRLTAHELLCHPRIVDDAVAPDKPIDSAVLSRLKQFLAMSKLKKMALRVIAESLSEEEIGGLKELFKMIDTDNSGIITIDELAEACREFGREFELMEKNNVQPNHVTSSIMLKVMKKSKTKTSVKEAWEFFQQMNRKSVKWILDVSASLIKIFCEEGLGSAVLLAVSMC